MANREGMNRRHFLQHVTTATALTAPAASMFVNALRANAAQTAKNNKACILLYMGAGPATIDIWDLKPGAPTASDIKPIQTSAPGMEISELLPMLAKQAHNLSIVRSMSTREADHTRGRYYMHTGYVPNPNIEYPSYGAVVSHELEAQSQALGLQVPPFVSVGGASVGPGFLGTTYSPFVVDSNGDVRNADLGLPPKRLMERMQMLSKLEKNFLTQNRGELPMDHAKVLEKTLALMTSDQMQAFKTNGEPQAVQERYGAIAPAGGQGMMARAGGQGFARGCLMARRLVEAGVPFVEVDFGGWDDHQNVSQNLKQRLPIMDQAMSALIEDLETRGMLQNTTIVWMGDFGRTPRINARAGRDHWARSWSCVVAGGTFKNGTVVGKTNADGTAVESDPYTSQDLMASVLKSMGISLETTFTSKNNRPMKIANSGRVIKELFA